VPEQPLLEPRVLLPAQEPGLAQRLQVPVGELVQKILIGHPVAATEA
jgi:hypothetical protein